MAIYRHAAWAEREGERGRGGSQREGLRKRGIEHGRVTACEKEAKEHKEGDVLGRGKNRMFIR